MTAAGVYHVSHLGAVFYRLDQVGEVVALSRGPFVVELRGSDKIDRNGDRLQPEETWIARFPRYRKRSRQIPAGHLTVHPGLAYKALVYYFEHPDRRTELGTDGALDRIRSADFSS